MKYIVYERDVCEIEEIKNKYFKDMDYYILRPLKDSSLKISVPINSSKLRSVMSEYEALELIDNMKNIEVLENERDMEKEYKYLLNTGNHEDLVKIIKTTYLRNKERLESKKKISEKDDNYFNKAEDYLYNELGVALNMKKEEVKEYIINKLKEKI